MGLGEGTSDALPGANDVAFDDVATGTLVSHATSATATAAAAIQRLITGDPSEQVRVRAP